MEEDRIVLGELLLTHTKLDPQLIQAERAAAKMQYRGLQEEWRNLERTAERTLHCINAHAQETSNLQSETSALKEHLEAIGKDLRSAQPPSEDQWNSKRAEEMMVVNAELTGAQQRYLHLQQATEALAHSSQWKKETKEIEQRLTRVKEQLDRMSEQVSSQTLSSSNPTMEKILKVTTDAFAWAKKTESDIDGRKKRVALLPEEVHRQIRDLKKLQSEMVAKQGQLEVLVEEVAELLPQLDQAEEAPMVHSLLDALEELSKSTTEKLARAVREMESGLQTREKMSGQIADLDSWVVTHLQRETSRRVERELQSPADLERHARQIQETMGEAEKQAAVCEALLMKSRDVASELSIPDNVLLHNKLTNLQEDIRTISSNEKANKQELEELLQNQHSSKQKLTTVEKCLRQMLVDLNRHRFPVTRESLHAIEPFKHMIMGHKSQVDLLQPYISEEKRRELLCIISELHSKMSALDLKARDHEMYLSLRQCMVDFQENVEEQVLQTKEESRGVEERYKTCQALLTQLPLMKGLCQDAADKLQSISSDLYPSQQTMERQRLKQTLESLDTWEMAVHNNISIMEWGLLKGLDLDSEQKATHAFLRKTQKEHLQPPMLEPKEEAIDKEYRRIVALRRSAESRMRALDVLEQKKGKRQGSKSQDLMDLKNTVLRECDLQMASCID